MAGTDINRAFSNLSIRRKLMTIILLTSYVVLFFASMTYVINEVVSFRLSVRDNLAFLADMIGKNTTAALTFNDHENAAEMMAGLSANPGILAAYIVDGDHIVFASYIAAKSGVNANGNPLNLERGATGAPSTVDPDVLSGLRSKADSLWNFNLDVVRDIRLDGKVIGTVVIQYDPHILFSKIAWLAVFFIAVLFVALFVAYFISSKLQGFISGPILELAETMKSVSNRKNYSVRSEKHSNDEFGSLIDGFNEMLAQIESRDDRLKRANLELRETVAQLEIAKQNADSANLSKSRFLANVSHEVRTPMNGVLGMTELLLQTSLNDKQRKCLDIIHKSAGNQLLLINQILDFSKIEAGRLELERADFDLHLAVEEAIELMAEHGHRKGLEMVCLIHDDVPAAVRGDQLRLRQILINLLGNAVKFTEEGEVALRVAADEVRDGNALLRFEVSDTGIGIDTRLQKTIFDSFSQADGSTTRKYGGTGLGLSIARQLAEMKGGEIGVESEPGQGSTFRFTVRLERQSPSAADIPVCDALHGLRLLIVDDNPTSMESIHYQAISLGMYAAGASSAAEALGMLRYPPDQRAYDIAVIDAGMPDISGFELAMAIRSDTAIASTRLVLLTSFGCDQEQIEEAEKIPDIFFLGKPVVRSRLGSCLASILAGTVKTVLPEGDLHAPSQTAAIRANVLVAEDNPINQDVVFLMLESIGCSATIVETGEQAVSAALNGSYDMVLMDCQMPVMDGFEAARIIRENEKEGSERRIPIIALTGNIIGIYGEDLTDFGMDDILEKPYTLDQLQYVIEKWTAGPPNL